MLQKYLTELKKIKMLSPEEERELWIREEEGDEAAHQKLISSYQPLVFKTAVQFHMPEEITLELIQEGTVGLLEAAESYDYTKGVAFSLYAVHRIRGRMCDFMNREFSRDELSWTEKRQKAGVWQNLSPGFSCFRKSWRNAMPYPIVFPRRLTGCRKRKNWFYRGFFWKIRRLRFWL